MVSTEAALSLPWYRSLSGPQWKTLVAANLSWTPDSFEFFALFLTVGFALHQLVDPAEYAAIPRYAGYALAATLFIVGFLVAPFLPETNGRPLPGAV
jgi:hypothetical protein